MSDDLPTATPATRTTGSSSAEALPTHVVGIGASAGGLAALERFFTALGDRTGMAYVVIQHLSPDFASMMPQILERTTRMPVSPVHCHSLAVERDTVYLLVPGKEMTISDGTLLTTDRRRGLNLPIDLFFRSLAEERGDTAIGIVLSGTGSDGASGMTAIHRAGGLTIAQTLRSAEFDGMPRSAVATGVVDLVLDPEHMPAALTSHGKRLALQFGRDTDPAPSGLFTEVFALLRDRFDIDFASYKPNTIMRRVERRMMARQRTSLNEYLRLLRADPEEIETLYCDLLIGVTGFFRDPEVWQLLAQRVIPALLRSGRSEIRVWSCACATGEEAYSLAILFDEVCRELAGSGELDTPPAIKIFATDVHGPSLHRAGVASWDGAAIEQALSPQRRKRCFRRQEDGSYAIAPHLRRMVVFARHDVTADPPFTRLDLVLCRNLLIYLNQETQQRLLGLFHFALRADGHLVLGASEGLSERSEDFEAVSGSGACQMFRKASERRMVDSFRMPAGRSPVLRAPPLLSRAAGRPFAGRPVSLARAYDALMEAYVPAGLLVSVNGEVAHTFGAASRFLKPPVGAVNLHAADMVVPELRLPVISALARVQRSQEMVAYAGVRVERPGDEPLLVRLVCRPLSPAHSTAYVLLTFEEGRPDSDPDPGAASVLEASPASADITEHLQHELKHAREQLQAALEELETSNEELQATNEELVASNEQLQSSNEELHSVNEELSTLNREHEHKIRQLQQITAETDNLIESLDTSAVFVDGERRIRRFTPQAASQFGLMKHDHDRRISHFNTLLAAPAVAGVLDRVERGGKRVEQEVQDTDGRWYLLRARPWRKVEDDPVDGTVLSFIDIERIMRRRSRPR